MKYKEQKQPELDAHLLMSMTCAPTSSGDEEAATRLWDNFEAAEELANDPEQLLTPLRSTQVGLIAGLPGTHGLDDAHVALLAMVQRNHKRTKCS